MAIAELLRKHDLFDSIVLEHGFAPHNRDFVIVANTVEGQDPGRYRFTFRGCVEATYRSSLPPGAFSLDPRLLEDWPPNADPPPGFVWPSTVVAYPGPSLDPASSLAASWSDRLGIGMHAFTLETNVFSLTLVFVDLVVEDLG